FPARRAGHLRHPPPLPTRRSSDLIGLALAAAAVYAQTFEPSYEEQLSNLTVHGRIGEVVHTSRYSVKVNWIKAALSVDTKNFGRSEEHTSEPSHVKISYAVFCLKK